MESICISTEILRSCFFLFSFFLLGEARGKGLGRNVRYNPGRMKYHHYDLAEESSGFLIHVSAQ